MLLKQLDISSAVELNSWRCGYAGIFEDHFACHFIECQFTCCWSATGVEKRFVVEYLLELAVLAELLLRGAQTEGELRGRAARMEPVSDLSELRPVLGALKAKNLVLPLTPEGRGHVVCHALYLPKELERIRLEYQPGRRAGLTLPEATPAETSPAVPGTSVPATTPATAPVPPTSPPGVAPEGAEALRRELAEVRDQLSQLRVDLDDVVAEQGRLTDEIRSLKEALGG